MMDVDVTAQAVIDLLAPLALETTRPIPRRVDIRIRAEDLVKAVQLLQDANWGYLVAITGVDHPAPLSPEGTSQGESSLEVLYSFGHGPVCLFLRISVPYSAARVETICPLIPSATLYERELMELFGVDVVGTPDRRRLIVADEFPEGVYPMRKSFKGRRTLTIDEEEAKV
jgi:Ni,Fe-hydrogenase III component G